VENLIFWARASDSQMQRVIDDEEGGEGEGDALMRRILKKNSQKPEMYVHGRRVL
jgi:hypothetical protein